MTARDKKRVQEERRLIGRRILRRRKYLNMTQGSLAGAVGVSFQQIQKYEKGASPIPERRLVGICNALEISPAYLTDWRAENADAFEGFIQSPEGVALCRAISQIADAKLRSRLVLAVGALCEGEMQPEDRDAAMLTNWLARIARSRDSTLFHKNAAAAAHDVKVELARLIGHTLKARRLTQAFAGKILRTHQARISDLARGKVKAVSLEKLLRFLALLGWDMQLVVTRRSPHRNGKIGLSLQGDEPAARPRQSVLR